MAPTRFKIFYKLDHKSDWISATDTFNKKKIKDQQGNLIQGGNISDHNTIYFNKPLYCRKLRIMMNEPTKKNSFSINKVNFFSMVSTGIFKAPNFPGVKGEMCWYINTDKPREGSLLIAYSCLDSIIMGTGNEIFNIETSGLIKLKSTGLCVGYDNNTTEVMLKTCSEERSAYQITYDKDNSMYFVGEENMALYIENKDKSGPNILKSGIDIIATSELDQNDHRKENVVLGGETSWTSAVGQKDVTIQFLFGKILCSDCPEKDEYESIKIDIIKIMWEFHPKKFGVYIWRPGFSWKNVGSYSNNTEKVTQISLVNESAAGIMIHITDGYQHQDYNNEIIYSMKKIKATYNGNKIKIGDKSSKDASLKFFDFEKQGYTSNTQTAGYENAFKALGITQEKCVSAYKMLKLTFPGIAKLKKLGNEVCNKIYYFQSSIGNNTIKSLTKFKSGLGKISNNRFLKFLGKFGEYKFGASMGMNLKMSFSGSASSSSSLRMLSKNGSNVKFGVGGLGISSNLSYAVKASISGRTSFAGGISATANSGSSISGKIGTSFGIVGISKGMNTGGSMGVRMGGSISVRAFLYKFI